MGRDEHVVAYSPVRTVGWAIVTEESWEMVTSPTLRASQMVPLVLVPALLLAMLALWFGTRQIVRPLQKLESKAARLAWGDFQEIEKPVGGIAEIRDLQNELAHMGASSRPPRRVCIVISARSHKARKPSACAWRASCTMTPSNP